MKRRKRMRMKKIFSAAMAAILLVGSVLSSNTVPAMAETISAFALKELTQHEVETLNGDVSYARTSVHDPSVVWDGDGNYYIFGSHMGVSKTKDLQNWTFVTGESVTSDLFGNAEGAVVSYEEAFCKNAYTGPVTVLDAEGNPLEVSLGTYDVAAWIGDNTVAGNMWAPDVLYNKMMGKWCMYLSLNGANWNSAVVLMTADNIEGPYVYQGPVVFSGFSVKDSAKSFKNTDLELVIGTKEELPVKYQKMEDGSWGTYWPHAIDPAVFYDEEGKLWLVYGSWSGGIYMLELDESTGLRDYTVVYENNFDTLGASVTSDAYFGKKIAGGYYVSGEGAYIEQIGNYYYLFVSYGFYSPEGGYNMRVFRSEKPDGPYVDTKGNSAIYNKYLMNYHSSNAADNYGLKLMGNYKWDTMEKAEVAQGHNSVFVDADGKAYVVYHTKFADGTATHEVRVHQLFMNEDGWLVAAPYEYSGETLSANGYYLDETAGQYSVLVHKYQVDYAGLEYVTPETIVLNGDGTVAGAYNGTWSMKAGTPYVTLVLNGSEYNGVFTEQVIDGSNIKVMCFTAVSDAGLCIWGSGEPADDVIVAQNAMANLVMIPENTYGNLNLITEGLNGATISWHSDKPEVLSAEGVVTVPDVDTVVTLTERISKGEHFFERIHKVTVKAATQNGKEPLVLATYFANEQVDLSKHITGDLSVANPFCTSVNSGIDVSGGVTVEFDALAIGDMHVLGTIFSFMAKDGAEGRLYFTPGSYLGYNATGGYFDANIKDFGLVKDYIGESAHVAVQITPEGFSVSVNGEVVYTEAILATENGTGTVADYNDVLNWLVNSADKLYFGHGSWWNAVGFDEANVLLGNVVCSVAPIEEPEELITGYANFTEDKVVLSSNADITYLDNPFKNVVLDALTISYTINFSEAAVMNGWDGLFSFYNSKTGGRVSVQCAPYVCYNDMAGMWMDVNAPGTTLADYGIKAGVDYEFDIVITKTNVAMYINGERIAITENGSGATYADLLTFIRTCDFFTWGVGQAETAYWWTEVCTLTDISLASKAPATAVYEHAGYTMDTVNYCEVVTNPYYAKALDSLYLEYTVNFSETAAKNGWDGLFSFYNSKTGGRVSVQSAPYICYNDMAGKWMDINQPGADGDNVAAAVATGEDVEMTVAITKDGIEMTANGVPVAIAVNGSGATYEDLLEFISECDQLTLGVGEAATSFWWSELATVSELKMSPVEIVNYTVDYKVTEGYGTYLQAAVTVKNTSEEKLDRWSLSFEYDGGTITSLWNAELVSQNGTKVLVNAPSWDKDLAAGEEVTVYFNVNLHEAGVVPVFSNEVVTGKNESAAADNTYDVVMETATEWPYGYNKDIVIRNNGDTVLESWTLEFEYEDNILSIWNAKILSHEGNRYVITNCGYNADIAVGGTVTVGFTGAPANGAKESTAEMTNVVLTGLK